MKRLSKLDVVMARIDRKTPPIFTVTLILIAGYFVGRLLFAIASIIREVSR